ncbi:MAG: cell division protein ZapA [Sutterellaceae bacterium]|nr:cell division protein ZapA [Sutterellaceae bacterium]
MPRITLNILDREYPFDVSEADIEPLKSAAELINTRASQIRSANRALTTERIAVMASLQIAFDSVTGRLGEVPVDEVTISRVAALRMKCDEALDPVLE